jgi:protein CpxP
LSRTTAKENEVMKRNQDSDRQNQFWRFNRWGSPILGILIILCALGLIAASNAETTDRAGDSCTSDACASDSGSEGHGGWGHRRGGHRFFGHGGRDPEVAREHMQYATGWMLRRLDVDDAVQEQIQARLDLAFSELAPLIESHKGSHGIWLDDVLGGDAVDRAGLESQRQQAIATADSASQIVAGALADVADMLTPEQRAQIAEKIRQHHRR